MGAQHRLTMTTKRVLKGVGASLLVVLGGLLATDRVAAQGTSAPAATESQREAAALLKSMAEYLAGLESLRCTTTNGYETVQANGQKIEFGETRKIFLARPNRLRVEEEASDGFRDLTLFDGKQITTVEGIGTPEKMNAVQQAFVKHDAQQCGFCTPGFVTAATAFVRSHPNATIEQVRAGLGGNLCRCGTYAGMLLAVADAAQKGGA